MPTPRQHGGAPLMSMRLSAPGSYGLNTEQKGALLGHQWATKMVNMFFDSQGRMAVRNGFYRQKTGTTTLRWVHLDEAFSSTGTSYLFGVDRSAAGGVFYSTDEGLTWNGATVNVTIDDYYKTSVISFNDRVYYFTYKTSGNKGEYAAFPTPTSYTAITDTNTPNSGRVVAAFGRLWGIMNDGHTVRYSALLDGTDWDGADAGAIDLWNVWAENDTVEAVTEYNGTLVVFGKNNIAMWTDGQGSATGLDPTQMYVFDTVSGTGCIAHGSIQQVEGDLWFLSRYGLQSLGQVVQEKSNPMSNLSRHVQSDFLDDALAATSEYVRSVYSADYKLYIISFPSGPGTETGTQWAWDTRGRLPDGTPRCCGTWGNAYSAFVQMRGGSFLAAPNDGTHLGTFTSAKPDGISTSMPGSFETGWFAPTADEGNYKLLLKRADWTIDIGGAEGTPSYGAHYWAIDYVDTGLGLDGNYTLSVGANVVPLTLTGTASSIKFGANWTVYSGETLALQEITLKAKVGRTL